VEILENEKIIEKLGKTLQEIAEKIKLNSNSLDSRVIIKLIGDILHIHENNAMIFIYGAGRSGFIGRCFAQRLMHLGIKSCFISDAITHRYTERDLLIIISGSGETTSPKSIANKAKEIGGRIALFTGNLKSSIAKISDLIIKIEGKSKDQATFQESFAPYTSLFDISTLAILDSIGGILMEILGVTEEDIDSRHASIE